MAQTHTQCTTWQLCSESTTYFKRKLELSLLTTFSKKLAAKLNKENGHEFASAEKFRKPEVGLQLSSLKDKTGYGNIPAKPFDLSGSVNEIASKTTSIENLSAHTSNQNKLLSKGFEDMEDEMELCVPKVTARFDKQHRKYGFCHDLRPLLNCNSTADSNRDKNNENNSVNSVFVQKNKSCLVNQNNLSNGSSKTSISSSKDSTSSSAFKKPSSTSISTISRKAKLSYLQEVKVLVISNIP